VYVTAQYVVHMLKLQHHYASFDKFYNLNMWIVLASLNSKVRVIFALPCSAVYFYKISRFFRIFDNSIIEDYNSFIQLAIPLIASLENRV